jgi:hypothetical protein
MQGRPGRTRSSRPAVPVHVSVVSHPRVRCVRGAVSRSVLMLGSKTTPKLGAAMHFSNTLVFGPLHPLFPQPVRVRLVVLLAGLICGLGILTLACLVLVLSPAALPTSARSLLPGWASAAEPKATTQQILVSSNPVGAAVLAGGRELGRTPQLSRRSPVSS